MIKIHCDFFRRRRWVDGMNACRGVNFNLFLSTFSQIEICLSPRMTLNQVAAAVPPPVSC